MLRGISPLISPSLLKLLAEMGHGDEIVLGDAYFPGHTLNKIVIRADGVEVAPLLEGISKLFPLDTYDVPVIMMAPVHGDKLNPEVEASYRKALSHDGEILRLDRFDFYKRSRDAVAIVITGGKAQYGNIILKKGVV